MLLCFHVAVYIDIKTTTRYEELLKKNKQMLLQNRTPFDYNIVLHLA